MTSSLLTAPPAVDRGPAGALPRLRRICYEPRPDPDPPQPCRLPAVLPHAVPAHPDPGHFPGQPTPRPALTDREQAERAARERAERADAHRAAAQFLRLALEVFDGNRAAAHIAGRASPSVLRYWQVATQRRRPRTAARFCRLRLCLPRRGVAEVAVTCEIDGRARALAARFERGRTGWCCTALRLG